MDKYTREELVEALRVVSSTISKCRKNAAKICGGYLSSHTP